MKCYPQWKPGKPCPGNMYIICTDHSQCSRCGWNPEVAEKRLQSIKDELKKKRRAANNG